MTQSFVLFIVLLAAVRNNSSVPRYDRVAVRSYSTWFKSLGSKTPDQESRRFLNGIEPTSDSTMDPGYSAEKAAPATRSIVFVRWNRQGHARARVKQRSWPL